MEHNPRVIDLEEAKAAGVATEPVYFATTMREAERIDDVLHDHDIQGYSSLEEYWPTGLFGIFATRPRKAIAVHVAAAEAEAARRLLRERGPAKGIIGIDSE